MGDLHRHAEIFEFVHRSVAPLRPDEDWVCLEIGNYLTDISQFRDPFAHMYAKRMVWGEGLAEMSWLTWVPVLGLIVAEGILNWAIDLDEWIDRLFGTHEPASARYGTLGEYFRKIFEGITHLLFSDDVPKAEVWRPLLAPALGDISRMPPTEVTRIYGRSFTQYYPHEHTDFPPYVLYGEQRPHNRLYRPGPNRLLAYLEEYIDYLAESLTKLEVDWKELASAGRADPRRHDILVRLGKVLHGIEDYYFHSNHLELQLWNEMRAGRPRAESDDDYRRWFAANVAAKWMSPGPQSTTAHEWVPSREHQVRAHLRRLRYPRYVPVNTLDPTTSDPALEVVFTAGFDKKDLFHTLSMVLESMEGALARAGEISARLPDSWQQDLRTDRVQRLRDTDLVLLRTLFDKSERSRLGRDERYRKAQLARHVAQLRANRYEDGIRHLHTRGYLDDSARDAWLAAIRIDREMEDFGDRTPGVSGFMIQLLAKGQVELEESRKVSARHDRAREFGEGNALDVRSDNGASGEHIGTHTLMAKDTGISHPVHEETRRVSRFASMAVARHLVTSVNAGGGTATGLDWDRILRHYLRFPHARAGMWETQVLNHVRRHGVDPTYDDIPDRVVEPRAQGASAMARMAARRSGDVRARLERRYIELEERVDHFQLLLKF